MPDDVNPKEPPAEPNPQPEQDVRPAPESQSQAEGTEEPQPLEEHGKEDHLDVPKTAQHHEEHHLIPIVLALALLIILAAIAIIGGDKINRQNTSDNGSTAQSVQAPEQTQTTAQAQDQQTLDDAIKTVNSLSADEDTSGQGLSDQNLGL